MKCFLLFCMLLLTSGSLLFGKTRENDPWTWVPDNVWYTRYSDTEFQKQYQISIHGDTAVFQNFE